MLDPGAMPMFDRLNVLLNRPIFKQSAIGSADSNSVEDGLPLDEEIVEDYEAMFQDEDFMNMLASSSSDEEDENDTGTASARDSHGNTKRHDAGQATIAQRTRAHISYTESEVKEMENLVDELDVEGTTYGRDIDDHKEYEKFLTAIRQTQGAIPDFQNTEEPVMSNEESEDEDFMLELKRLLEEQVEEQCWDHIDLPRLAEPNVSSDMPMDKINMLLSKTSKSTKTKVRIV